MKNVLTSRSKIVAYQGKVDDIVNFKTIDEDLGILESLNINVDSIVNNIEFKLNELGFIIDNKNLNLYLLINNDGDLIIYTNNKNINFIINNDGYLICEYIL
jgi:hypothetical protein